MEVMSFFEQQYISLIAFALFFILQIYFFATTRMSVNACRKIFPVRDMYSVSIRDGWPSIDCVRGAKDFEVIRNQTNAYLSENKAAVDLAELKDIADRYSDTKYGEATSHLSIPMYLGLMGTYVGVAIGLVMLLLVKSEGQPEQIINQEALFKFIGGVVVAMMTSFCGLILTTVNNRRAAGVEEELCKTRDGYFQFLQTKVLPSAPSTIAQTFQNSVAGLQTTVERLSTDLTDTFSGITRDFGQNLRENLGQIETTVAALKESAATFRDSMETQRTIVSNMMSDNFIAVLKKIDKTVDKCAEIGDEVEKTNVRLVETVSLQSKVADTQHSIAETQISIDNMLMQQRKEIDAYQADLKLRMETESAESRERFRQDLEHTSRLFKDVEEVLNRFKTFEEHVNKFAEAEVGQNTGVLERIDAQIKRIESVRTDVDTYLDTSSEDLHAYLKTNQELIKKEIDKFKKDWGEFFFQMNPEKIVSPESFLEKLSALEGKLSALEEQLGTISTLIPPQSNHSEMLLQLKALQKGLEKRQLSAGTPGLGSGALMSNPGSVASSSKTMPPATPGPIGDPSGPNSGPDSGPDSGTGLGGEAPKPVGFFKRLFGK